MSSFVKISSPFIKNFEHQNIMASGSYTEVIPKADAYKRRVSVIIQNQGSTSVFFNSDGNSSSGILIAAGFTLSFENYNGAIWIRGNSGGELVSIAIAYA
jgi:hypothetical protein